MAVQGSHEAFSGVPYFNTPENFESFQWIGGSVARVLIDAETSGGTLSVFERLLPGDYKIASHTHFAEDESFLVLGGRITGRIGATKFDLSEGAVAHMPRGVPHNYQVASDHARLIFFNHPGGIEGIFRHAGWNLEKPVPSGWDVDYAAIRDYETSRGNKPIPLPR